MAFLVNNQGNKVRFLEKNFLIANISLKIIFGISFLTLSGIDVDFLERELKQRTYTTKKALSTTKGIKLVEKKEFAAVVLNSEYKTFIVHIASLENSDLSVYLSCRSQVASLISKKASKIIFTSIVTIAITSFPLSNKLEKV